ncbi:MAG: flagellar brake protein [Nitrospinota bacterium]
MVSQNGTSGLADIGFIFDNSIESMLPIGDPIQITCQEKRSLSTIRGVVALKHLIVDTPLVGGKKFYPDYGSIITVRFLLDGAVYGFKTGIVRVHEKSGLIVLEYPDSIRKVELRKSKRLNVMISAVITTGCETDSDTGQTWTMETLDGAILDISEVGALLAVNSSELIDVGHTVAISTTLPGGMHVDSLDAEIRNIKPSSNKLLLGVSFSKVNDKNSDAIKTFYADCISYKASADYKG